MIKPLGGNILDIEGSMRIGDRGKLIPFQRVREKVKKELGKRAAEAGAKVIRV